jgi:hypothetical protein
VETDALATALGADLLAKQSPLFSVTSFSFGKPLLSALVISVDTHYFISL